MGSRGQRSELGEAIDIKAKYGSASFLAGNHVVFNIKGNNYRLLVQITLQTKIVLVRRSVPIRNT